MSSNGSYFMVQKNQNAATYQSVINTTSGTAAYAGLFVSGVASLSSAIGTIALSAGYTTAGILVANTGVLFSNMAAGINIGTSNNTQASIWTNGVSRISITGAGAVSIAGVTTFNNPITLKGYTVATLPAGVIGYMAYATDLLSPTFLAIAVGGGAVKGVVFYNGTNWVTI